ncbi:MAG TPA: hypothetical protein PLD84_08190 [Chitinophagales bacterium]|nr:hypothetical protein [Chitinophagales bacterium]
MYFLPRVRMQPHVFRITISVIIAFFITHSFDGFSQTKKEVASRRIESVSISTFDARRKDTTSRKNYSLYDQRGNVIESIEYDSKGNIKSHEKFEFNRNDDETVYRSFDADGKISRTIYTSYDKWNHVAEKSTMDAQGNLSEKMISTYNVANDLITETTTDKEGKIIHQVIYSYDNKGMMLSRKIYNEKHELIYSKEYTYQY